MKESGKQRFNILYCSMGLTFGGEQKQLVKILSYINRDYYQPIVCCIRQFGYVEQKILDLTNKFICFQIPNRYHPLGEIWRLCRVIIENNIDIVHTGIFGSEFSPIIAGIITRVPIIAYLTTTYDLKARLESLDRKRAFQYLKARLFYMVHAICARIGKIQYVAYSQSIKTSAIKDLHLPPERITIIPLGLDLNEFSEGLNQKEADIILRDELGINGSYPILINVARLSSVKGQKDLLKAMPRILEHFPEAQLLIVGDGDTAVLRELERLREYLGLVGHVHFLGRRDDIIALLNASDIFVFSSFYEGLPGAVLEAMAIGKPFVAFDIPSLKELYRDNDIGILVKGRDIDQFAEAIVNLAKQPNTIKKSGSRAKQIVYDEFDVRKNLHKLEELYQQILKNGRFAEER